MNESLTKKKIEAYSKTLDTLAYLRTTLEGQTPLPVSVIVAYENLYSLIYVEHRRLRADLEQQISLG